MTFEASNISNDSISDPEKSNNCRWRRQVEDLQAQAEDALAKLEKDPQAVHSSGFQQLFSAGVEIHLKTAGFLMINQPMTHQPKAASEKKTCWINRLFCGINKKRMSLGISDSLNANVDETCG